MNVNKGKMVLIILTVLSISLPSYLAAQTKVPVKKAIVPTVQKPASAMHPPEPDYIKLGGVAFLKDPIDNVFAKAKAAGKPVFIEVYSPDCHVCQSFMPTMANKKVGEVYNQAFVSTKLDLMQRSTQEWLEKKKLYVPSLPLFLYFDADGNLLHIAMTNNSVDEVNARAMAALNPQVRSQQFPQRYAAGDRDINFLIEYGLITKIVRDTVANSNVMKDYAKLQPDTEYNNGTNWLVLQKVIMDYTNPIAQYLINNQDAYKQYGETMAKEVAENLLLSALYSPQASRFVPEKVIAIKEQLVKIGIDSKIAIARTLMPEVTAYINHKQMPQAINRMDKHVTDFPLTAPEYLYVVRFFNSRSIDLSDVPFVVKWAEKGLALNKLEAVERADLYYEIAEAYRRSKQLDDARKAAQSSLLAAQTGKINTKRYADKITELK